MRILTTVLAAAVALSIASPVYAQTTGTSSSQKKPSTPKKPAPPLPKPKMNFRAFGTFEVEMMSASDTFKAVTGSSSVIGYGGGGEVLNLWKTLFVRGDIVLSSTSGERAFAIGDEVISTGIPIDVKLQTLEVAGGWRLRLRKLPKYTPYFGGGALFVSYSEKSDLEQPTDTVNESFSGYTFFGGVDIQLQPRWFAQAEVAYRMVPDALGTGGISKIYGETDLGGIAVRVLIGYNLKK